ncbi:MAG: hypothetical protein U0270_25800 [Labilithrix sp.]
MQRSLPVLQTLIAAPCDVPWAAMPGDHRTRRCGECKRDVHNLSAMTEAEMAAFLDVVSARPENQRAPCISLFQRSDGTVLTADCPVGLSRRRRRALLTATLSAGAVALVAVSALAMLHYRAQDPEPAFSEGPAPAVLTPAVPAYPAPLPSTITPRHTRDPGEGVQIKGEMLPDDPPARGRGAPPPTSPKTRAD